jgi:hypothetical protein
MTGTPEGRLFLAGKDGCLYELIYQAQERCVGSSLALRCLYHIVHGLLGPFLLKFLITISFLRSALMLCAAGGGLGARSAR